MFTVEMLPAERGDALWLTYGTGAERHHVLIDGGPKETRATLVPELERRLDALGPGDDRVELLVITHIDADHIQGIVSLLSGPGRVRQFRDIWFNGFKHLSPETLGGPDGEMLTRLLESEPKRWNRAFKGKAVVVPEAGALPSPIALAGGLELQLLSPTPSGLARLIPKWEKECAKAGLIPGKGAAVPRALSRDLLGFDVDVFAKARYTRDRAEANGSSISFIARFEGRTLLCGADAHSEMLEAGLDRLGPGPHELTAIKVSHHGSRGNLSPAFVGRVRSRHWLLSTNGARFSHPHPETVARIVVGQEQQPTFHLNYVSEDVTDVISGARGRYTVKLPAKRGRAFAEGLVVKLH